MPDRDFSQQTREVYHRQHVRVANDAVAMARFVGMFSAEYFGLPTDYFHGKRILDAGCGDTAKLMIAMHQLGARDIHGFDLDESYIPVARESMARHGVDHSLATLKIGNILAIPYPANTFDFVASHGVLVHLNSLDEVRAAFGELARVTKPGGHLYTVFGIVGGLFEGAIVPALRNHYERDAQFRQIVDGLKPEDFHSVIDFVVEKLMAYEDYDVDLTFLKTALDVDLCVTFQNVLQAPVRLAVDKDTISSLYAANGFVEPRRLKRYVKRRNIRRFFAPLHYHTEHPVSQLFYGSGSLEFIGAKG